VAIEKRRTIFHTLGGVPLLPPPGCEGRATGPASPGQSRQRRLLDADLEVPVSVLSASTHPRSGLSDDTGRPLHYQQQLLTVIGRKALRLGR
jgi:hypothetical protein